MVMPFPVPYLSQYSDVSDPFWQERACGVACLGMMIAHARGGEPVDLDALVREADAIGARDPSVGWIHAKLIELGAKYGVTLESRVYRANDPEEASEKTEQGIADLKRALAAGRPVIVSVLRGFIEHGTPHMVVVVGVAEGEDQESLVIHDPDAKDEFEGGNRIIATDTFRQHWRKLAIFPARPRR